MRQHRGKTSAHARVSSSFQAEIEGEKRKSLVDCMVCVRISMCLKRSFCNRRARNVLIDSKKVGLY